MERKTGGCHCGKVRYEADLDLAQPVIECNCSHCQMKGTLLTFVPETGFTLLSGEDDMTEYRFNKHVIAHLFCSTCGVQPFGRGQSADGTKTVAINVRTIDDIDLGTLTRVPYDGRSK